jgi:hypothetical protein
MYCIPAPSFNCKRCFDELGDLLELQRRKIGPELLAALHCIRSWANRKVGAATVVNKQVKRVSVFDLTCLIG